MNHLSPWLLLLVVLNFAGSAIAAPPTHAIYIHTSLFDQRDLSEDEREMAIAEAMDRMVACGFDTIYPYANTSSGKSFYPSAYLEPTRSAEADTLGLIVKAARARGLRVVPSVCVLTSGHHKVRGLVAKDPDWALRTEDNEPMGWISPAHPAARARVVAVIVEVLSHTQADGILLDYLRFPNEHILPDPESAARFEAQTPEGETLDERKVRYQRFREDMLTLLAKEISVAVRREKPGAILGLYTWGPHVPFDHKVAQCWPDWVAADYINLVNVSGYCYPENYKEKYLQVFEARLQGAKELVDATGKDVPLTFALGVKTSHGAIKSTDDIRDYLRLANKVGLQGTAAFSWTHLLPYVDAVLEERVFIEPWPTR